MKKRKHIILFVDDDPLILKAIKRSLDEYLDDWDIEYAQSGRDALNLLETKAFDAVISDMLMPGMDGLTLLEEISKRHSDILRFIFSGNTSDAQLHRTAQLVHQMFPKPYSIESVYEAVERACRLRDELSEPNLIRIITGIKTLPSMPALYNKILRELQSDEPDMKLIVKIISQDTAMTAKILQLVNSAFLGLAENVSSPQRAVAMLGLNTVKALVLSVHIFSEYQGVPNLPISVDTLWKHSISVSGIARLLASDLRLSQQDQEDVQVAGILHDIGRLLELKIPNLFRKVQIDNGLISVTSEYQNMGTSHAEMGAYLLGIWGLPGHIVEAVLLHHRPSAQVSEKVNILSILHISNGLVNMYTFEKENKFDKYLDLDYIKKLGLEQRLDAWAQMSQNVLKNT